MNPSAEDELRFLRNFKKAIYHFNLLEENLYLFIKWHHLENKEEIDMDKILAKSFDDKKKSVEKLISQLPNPESYEGFLRQADKCRLFRNKLVHGEWYLSLEGAIRYHVRVPEEEQDEMTQEEFEEQVELINHTIKLFSKLRGLT